MPKENLQLDNFNLISTEQGNLRKSTSNNIMLLGEEIGLPSIIKAEIGSASNLAGLKLALGSS